MPHLLQDMVLSKGVFFKIIEPNLRVHTYICYICVQALLCTVFAGDSMLIMRSHGVSTAVKRNAADDI